jgi:hypothetical protein
MRGLLAIIGCYATWTILWLAGNLLVLQAIFPSETEAFSAGGALTNVGYLSSALVLSIICSITGGLVCAQLARGARHRDVIIMSILLLATGIAVQAGVWNQMPLWYHLSFLVLIVPSCLMSVGVRSNMRGAQI